MTRTALATVALTTFALTASGCLVVSGKHIDETGVRISESTLNQVTPGHTTEAWLLATLGEPTDRTIITEYPQVSVLKYKHVETRSSGGAVFLIFAGGSETTRTTTSYFELTDGVVTRHWTEHPRGQ